MKINESIEIHENVSKSMKIYENPWKSMKAMEDDESHQRGSRLALKAVSIHASKYMKICEIYENL